MEDSEGVVVFLTAGEGLSVAAVDPVSAPAWAVLCWPGVDVAWSCSAVCSVVLWLTGVV